MANASTRVHSPATVWVDVEVATGNIHDAEVALKAGDPARAYGPSAVAQHIARRPFLAGESGAWAELRRDKSKAPLGGAWRRSIAADPRNAR